MEEKTPDEVQEYLAKIKRTVAESEAMIEAVQLRIAETDRLLAANGLSREALAQWRPPAGQQRLAINEVLRKNGLPPLEEDECAADFDAATEQLRAERREGAASRQDAAGDGASGTDDATAERQRKFRNFMRDYRI